MNLSACIVVRNQAIFLDRCLQSIKSVCNEIIIVHDGPCSDDSLKIAKRYKALIFIRPFIGEAEYHRPFAFGKSTGDWILQIDADEYLSAEALSEIPILIQSRTVDAYAFRWPYYDGHSYISHGPFSKTFKPCLFRKSKLYMIGISHEYPRTYGMLKNKKDILLEHRPNYDNYSQYSFQHKWKPWIQIQARQILTLESMPHFNINAIQNNPQYQYYFYARKKPLMFFLSNVIKFIGIYLLRGILWAGIKSWSIAFFELKYYFTLYRFLVIDKI